MYFQISLVKYFQISFSIFLKYLSSAFYDLPCEPLYTVSIGLQQFKCLLCQMYQMVWVFGKFEACLKASQLALEAFFEVTANVRPSPLFRISQHKNAKSVK